MQKKKLYQLIAAIVLVAVVAVVLITVGLRGGNTASGSVPQAPSESAALSEETGKGPDSTGSSAAASSESAASGSETPSASEINASASAALEEIEEELAAETAAASSSTASSSSAASSEKAASSTSSKAVSSSSSKPASSASASHSQAASGTPAGSAASSAPSSTASSESAVDAQINNYVKQLEKLRDQTESKLYGVIYEAYHEYIAHPVEERSMGLKISIVVSKTAKLTSVQSECDKEFNALLAELRQYLRDNGRDQTVADQAEQEYKTLKSNLTSDLTSIVYNSAVGSGDGAKWIQKNIEHKR